VRSTRRALVAGVAVVAGCGGGGDDQAPVAATPPQDFVGIVSDDTFARENPYRSRQLRQQQAAGVRLIRRTFDWTHIEEAAGRYQFDYYDRYLAEVVSHRLRLLPIIFNPPPFRSSAPARGARRGTYPPRRAGDMARFATVLARRYGPGGDFWEANPHLPRLPIRSWQVWNEPNIPVYWPSGPDAGEYVELLSAVAAAIRKVDRHAEIVAAGMAESDLGVPFSDFLTDMYESDAEPAFDTLAVHAFAGDPEGTVRAVEDARKIVSENGDDAPIWVTEFGWASGGPSSPFTVGASRQATNIRAALLELARRREELGLRGVVYYNWRDAPPFEGGEDFFGLHTGLLRVGGTAKPGLEAFSAAARQIHAGDVLR
jgi:hypothetical protein